MNKQVLLLLVLVACTYGLRQNCHNPASDYVLHMRDSGNFGTSTVQGYASDEAFEFSGDGQYRDFGPTNIGGNISISFWAKWEGLNSWSRIMDFANGPASDNILIANEAKTANFIWDIFQGNQAQIRKRVDWIRLGVWNHYVVTINEAGVKQIFVNGKEVGVNGGGNTTIANVIERKFSYLGRSNWGHDGYFQGTLDEFVIYDRILEREEINCLADLCDGSCNSTCEGKANECHAEFEGDNEDDSCPLPVDAILSQEDANQNGEFAADQPGPATNNAAVFTGENFLDFGPQTIGGNLSFCMWTKFDAKGSWQRMFDFGKGAHNHNILVGEEGVSNTIAFHQYGKGGPGDVYRIEQGFDLDTWHHWCFTSDLNGNQQMFRDGHIYGTQNPRTHGRGIARILRENTFLGKSNWSSDAMTKGSIDGFQVFPRVLRPSEIACLGAVCPDECVNGAEVCALNGPFCKEKKCVTIHSECNFEGTSQEICGEEPELDSQEIKSINVPEGVKFSLYNGHNFENQVAYFTKSVECLDNINWEDQEELEADGIQLVKKSVDSTEDSNAEKTQHLKKNMKTKKQQEQEKQQQQQEE